MSTSPQSPNSAPPESSGSIERLLVALRAASANGTGLTEQDIQHFVRFLVVSAYNLARPAAVAPAVVCTLGSVAHSAGARESDSPKEILAKIEQFYESNPPHPLALKVFADWRMEMSAKGQRLPGIEDLAKLAMDSPLANFDGRLGSEERPAGTVRAGPMAGFFCGNAAKKK